MKEITLKNIHLEYEKRAFARHLLVQLPYVAIALCEESGEIAGKVKRLLRDDPELTTEKKKQIAEEVADVLFYLDWIAFNIGYDLQECYNFGAKKFDRRKINGTLHGSGDSR